jgi:mono/diheme cytochrome c family protein
LKEKAGHPWTTLPDYLFAHAAAGYGGQGTLCGALGVCSALINIVEYDKEKTYVVMVDDLLDWYARSLFPTDRFDDISKMPKQIQTKAMSPLCHTSVSKWTMAAGAQVTSKEKKERCAKVTGEVVYTTVHYLNLYKEGKWQPVKWTPKKEISHCIDCHGPDDMWHEKGGMNHQQGHMDCLLCHPDHTKTSAR